MQLSGRPLISARDGSAYVARTRIDERLRSAIVDRANILVTGPRGVGKTSTATQALLAGGIDFSVVNASLASSPHDLLGQFLAATSAHRSPDEQIVRSARLDAPATSLAARVAALRTDRPATIFVDNLEDPDLALGVFGRLRDELWATNIAFVVICEPEATGVLIRPPADAFFDVRIAIEPMNESEQRLLLQQRDADALSDVLQGRPATPRAVLARARAASASESGEVERLEGGERQAAARGETHARTFDAIRQLSRPLAAGDHELMMTVGLSRPRLARVLADLEEEELLASYSDDSGRPGRPARLFVLADPVYAA